MLLVRTVLKVSPIDGIGCFAGEHIAQGQPVWRFVPEFDRALRQNFAVADSEFLHRYAQLCPYSGLWMLCVDNARFMNHSDNPNVAVKAPLSDPSLTHDAVREILTGEELTCDYRVGDAVPFDGFVPVKNKELILR